MTKKVLQGIQGLTTEEINQVILRLERDIVELRAMIPPARLGAVRRPEVGNEGWACREPERN